MPPTSEVTVPLPAPAVVTVSVRCTRVKVAVTDLAASIVRLQDPGPEHAPLQPVKVEPAAGVAVSVTVAPSAKDALQVAPQLIPEGLLVTVPEPLPAFKTASSPRHARAPRQGERTVGRAVRVLETVDLDLVRRAGGDRETRLALLAASAAGDVVVIDNA